ncbi:MAG: VOC family protein [Nitrospirae bacterium]|nr:MAG: VOC family protein [Nitrospirota bacterium]
MKAHYLGHVVFNVKDFQRSLVFYRDRLEFKEIRRVFNWAATALTSGQKHHSGRAGKRDDICQSVMRGGNTMSTTHRQQRLNDLFCCIRQDKIKKP